jgi:hypothetical protein
MARSALSLVKFVSADGSLAKLLLRLVAASLVLFLLAWGIQKLLYRGYKTFVDHPTPNPRIGGPIPFHNNYQTKIPPTPLSAPIYPTNPHFYPENLREEATGLVTRRVDVATELDTLPQLTCKGCKRTAAACNCGEGQSMVTELTRKHMIELNNIDFELYRLYSKTLRPDAILPGVNYTFPLKAFPLIEITYTMTKRLFVEDHRPTVEKHIQVGNCKFYIMQLTKVELNLPFFKRDLPIRILDRVTDIPQRDLVVSEDHICSLRRGTFKEFDKAAKGVLESSLSIPISDPSFLAHQCDPIKDGYFFLRCLKNQEVPSYNESF